MSAVKTAHVNILEGATVTLIAGAEDAAYPLYRIHDRNVGRVFRASSATTLIVRVDQGASSIQAADALMIPSGHGLPGLTLDIMHSDDDITYTPATPQWAGAAGVIVKSWASVVKRYWEFTVTAPASIPSLSELSLTSIYTWPRQPQRPYGPYEAVPNVGNLTTSGGGDRWLVYGPVKRRRPYTLRVLDAQRDEIESLWASYNSGRPFWLCDHAGAWIFGKLATAPSITETAYGVHQVQFDFLEVLP